jgi:hypothetical protein
LEKECTVANAIELLRSGKKAEIWERYCGYLDMDIRQFMAIQRSLLEEQLAKYGSCELWQSIMRGARPRTVEEFRASVPLTTYREYAPFLLSKKESALPEKAFTWVHTSGRSGEYDVKWIPYSRALYDKVGEAFLAAFLVASAKRKGDVVLREGMSFPYLLAPPPYISGVITESLLQAFPFTVLPSLDRAVSLGFQERIEEAFDCAMGEGLDFFWGMTSILMKLGESFGSGGGTRGSAAKLIKRPRALLRVLKALLAASLRGRPLMPKDIWKVKGAICGGMDTTILKDKVAELWGIVPLEGYGCTEFGAIAFQTWNRENLTFYPHMNFWEFIAEKDYRSFVKDPRYIPRSFLLDEVRAGEDYVLVGTNFHGGAMLRYILGDLVRITSLEDGRTGIRLPQMTFVSRIDGLIDIGGFTRLTEKTIWKAIQDSGIAYEEWTIRKENMGDTPMLRLYIELRDGAETAQSVSEKVHASLKALDEPYRDMEEIAALRPLSVTLLTKGSFRRYFEERQASGADLAQTKPPHVNAPDKVVDNLVRMSNWRI